MSQFRGSFLTGTERISAADHTLGNSVGAIGWPIGGLFFTELVSPGLDMPIHFGYPFHLTKSCSLNGELPGLSCLRASFRG